MAKGGQSDQMKSLKKSNDSLKKQLENARKDIKRLEERVEVQEHASKEHNGGPSREVQLETERSFSAPNKLRTFPLSSRPLLSSL